MLSKTIWLVGLLLEAAILMQSLRSGLFRRFPVFYTYLFCVLVSSAGMWFVQKEPWPYFLIYWISQPVMIFLGYGVVLEIMHHALIHYPGAERFARVSGFLVFAILFSALAASWLLARNPFALDPWYNHLEVLERDFRMVQAIFLVLIAIVVIYYRIELGKNVQGLLFGLGIYVSVSIMSPELRLYFDTKFETAYRELQSVTYLATLCIWAVALWSTAEVPVPPRSAAIEADYERMAERIRDRLRSARSYLRKAVSE
jgi:hypothetical protein